MSEQSRKAFEAWSMSMMLDNGLGLMRAESRLSSDPVIASEWEVWQASRATALEEAAKVCEDMHEEDRPGDYAYAIRSLAEKTGKD